VAKNDANDGTHKLDRVAAADGGTFGHPLGSSQLGPVRVGVAKRVCVVTCAAGRVPGSGGAVGEDGIAQVPYQRWDVETYYQASATNGPNIRFVNRTTTALRYL
jgi:hypothetical protein